MSVPLAASPSRAPVGPTVTTVESVNSSAAGAQADMPSKCGGLAAQDTNEGPTGSSASTNPAEGLFPHATSSRCGVAGQPRTAPTTVLGHTIAANADSNDTVAGVTDGDGVALADAVTDGVAVAVAVRVAVEEVEANSEGEREGDGERDGDWEGAAVREPVAVAVAEVDPDTVTVCDEEADTVAVRVTDGDDVVDCDADSEAEKVGDGDVETDTDSDGDSDSDADWEIDGDAEGVVEAVTEVEGESLGV